MTQDNEITEKVAKFIAETEFENLSQEAVLSTKMSILDTIGVMFPASTLASASDIVHDFYSEIDNGNQCTLVGYREKASLLAAAMINGSLTHAVDFDDFSGIDKPMVHPTANCLPAALALAEYSGGISGKKLITAITLANDIGIRMCACVKGSAMHDYDFFPQTVFGVFQATIAASKLLSLNAEQVTNALGLAVNRVAGISDSLFSCEFRSIRDSFGNEEGIRCAMLAAKGFTGCKNGLEILYRVIYDNQIDPKPLTETLGEEFYTVKLVGYKPWPSCQSTQPYAQVVLESITNNALHSADIKHIELFGCKNGADAFFPKEEKSCPKSSITAKTALPYVVAIAALRRNIVLSDFIEANLNDPDVFEMTKRIDFEIDDDIPLNSAVATITLKNGNEYTHRVDILRGNVLNPMSLEEIVLKFRHNAVLAKCPPTAESIDAIIDGIQKLEQMDSVSTLMGLISSTE